MNVFLILSARLIAHHLGIKAVDRDLHHFLKAAHLTPQRLTPTRIAANDESAEMKAERFHN